jgi:hypothetical protein
MMVELLQKRRIQITCSRFSQIYISTYESEHTTLYRVVVVEDYYYMLLISFRFFSMLYRADFLSVEVKAEK